MNTEVLPGSGAKTRKQTALVGAIGIGACALACAAGAIGAAGLLAAVASALAGWWWVAAIVAAATAAVLLRSRKRRAKGKACEGSCAVPDSSAPTCGCASHAEGGQAERVSAAG